MIKHYRKSSGEQKLENQNAAIIIRIKGFPKQIGKITQSTQELSAWLYTKWGRADLQWIEDDGYAFVETDAGQMLLVFSPNGYGFCIDASGNEIPLNWHH